MTPREAFNETNDCIGDMFSSSTILGKAFACVTWPVMFVVICLLFKYKE